MYICEVHTYYHVIKVGWKQFEISLAVVLQLDSVETYLMHRYCGRSFHMEGCLLVPAFILLWLFLHFAGRKVLETSDFPPSWTNWDNYGETQGESSYKPLGIHLIP